jgi:hypothetical protein
LPALFGGFWPVQSTSRTPTARPRCTRPRWAASWRSRGCCWRRAPTLLGRTSRMRRRWTSHGRLPTPCAPSRPPPFQAVALSHRAPRPTSV